MEDFIFSEAEKDILNSVLDEQERTYAQHFVDDERLFEAVKKILLLPMYNWGVVKKGKKPNTDVNFVNGYLNLTDQNLGAQVRAVCNGMFFIEKGFALLKTLKKPKEIKVGDENPAV